MHASHDFIFTNIFICYLFSFTDKDLDVTCHHLGFLMGNFTYHSFADNLTNYILWEKPSCTGTEDSLFDCPGVLRIQHGAHVCGR